jgi:hypothetical protein
VGGLGAACSSGSGGAADRTGSASTEHVGTTVPERAKVRDPAGITVADLPTEDQVFGWIEEIVSHGIRRPGYPADVWVERWIEQQFREMGLEDVHTEPVPLRRWQPGTTKLTATTSTGETKDVECFGVPYSRSAERLELELAAYDKSDPSKVEGKASLYPVNLITLPATYLANQGDVPKDMTGRIVDDAARSLAKGSHTVPFAPEFQAVADPSIKAKAAAFIGTLTGSPGDTHEYYVPYNGVDIAIPGVWISESGGKWLTEQLADGPVHVTITAGSKVTDHTSFNIVGDLPGPGDEFVIVGSHHDGPWASAVEDASGTSLVLAQAHYWSRRPAGERPHRMRFVLQGGHMCGGAGLVAYVGKHKEELKSCVLEVHLEHVCLEVTEGDDGDLVVSDRAVPRWWFTSRHASLEKAVAGALAGEELTRSMVMAPDAFGPLPPTDGNAYAAAGVPIVQFLAAPWYLFDSIDTIDKIDRANLVPITRAAIRILMSTKDTTATKLRAEPGTA